MQQHRLRPALLVLALAVMLVTSASAHMKLEKTEPAEGATLASAPPHIQMWFTQEPDLAVTRVELSGPGGAVELGEAHVMEAQTLMATVRGTMGDGSYTVTWQTAGDDGHLQKGEFSFEVKHTE